MSQPHAAQHGGAGWGPGCHGGCGGHACAAPSAPHSTTTGRGCFGAAAALVWEAKGKASPLSVQRVFYGTTSGSGPCHLQQHLCPRVPRISPAGTKRDTKAPHRHDSRGSGPPAQHCLRARCPSAARAAVYPSLHAGRHVSAREPWEPECKYFIVNQKKKKKRQKKCYYRNGFTWKRLRKRREKKKPSDVLQPFMVSMPTTCRANSTTDGTCLAFPSQTRGRGRAGAKPPPSQPGTLSPAPLRAHPGAAIPASPKGHGTVLTGGQSRELESTGGSQVKLRPVGLRGQTDGCLWSGMRRDRRRAAPAPAGTCPSLLLLPEEMSLGPVPPKGGISHRPCSSSTRRAPQIPTAAGCRVRSREVSCCKRCNGPCSAAPPRCWLQSPTPHPRVLRAAPPSRHRLHRHRARVRRHAGAQRAGRP